MQTSSSQNNSFSAATLAFNEQVVTPPTAIKKTPGRIDIKICDKNFTLFRPGDLEEIWNNLTSFSNEDERLPYWVELWDSSCILSKYLFSQQDKIKGKMCLDIGCGLGLTAMAARSQGAQVLAFDYEFEALQYANKNARFNNFNDICFANMDFRQLGVKAGSIDFAFGGDIMYEKRFAEPLAKFLEYALSPKGVVWIAEPSRKIYENILPELFSHHMNVYCTHKESTYPEFTGHDVTVKIWEVKKDKFL